VTGGLREVAIAGVGATPFWKRGRSLPRTVNELIGHAVLAALADAGLATRDIDGFAYFANGSGGPGNTFDTAYLMRCLGIPEVSFSAALTMGGGGSAGAIGLAATAIRAGEAECVVTIMALQQNRARFGTAFASGAPTPDSQFLSLAGLVGPGPTMAPIARRHMHLYGTRREAFAEVALAARANALTQPGALMQTPLSLDDYHEAKMIAEPMCLFDFCLESDGAVAVITTSAERARDLRRKPVQVQACVHGGSADWANAFLWHNMPDEVYASSGHRSVARRLYQRAGMQPSDIDVALLYDHFTPMVIMQLEDYGFCAVGEGGPFVESGAIRLGGSIPVNPHGGNLSHAYVMGLTHVVEAVEQLRGSAANQVPGAEFALITGGPAPLPVSGLILRS
jgi:acetyl-CoA acetyltransferase